MLNLQKPTPCCPQNSLVAGSLANYKHLKENAERERYESPGVLPTLEVLLGDATAGGTKKALNMGENNF